MLRRILRHPFAVELKRRLVDRVARAAASQHSAPQQPHPPAPLPGLRIDNTSTAWVFLSDSDEPRHLWDIALGARVLKLKNVPNNRIHVCTNHIGAAQHLNPYGIHDIRPIAQLELLMQSIRCDVLVLVVGGHGTVQGAGQGTSVVSPADAIAKVRRVPGLKGGVIVLSQCFAGVFNLMDADADPPLVIIGATNLNESVSSKVDLQRPLQLEDGSPGVKTWLANIFSLNFFVWLEAPPDVDGDGELTILDAFKFAGARSNQQLITAKSELFMQALSLADQLRGLVQQAAPTPQAAGMKMLQMKATEQRLLEVLKMLYLHQEPWILHAKLARRISISLKS